MQYETENPFDLLKLLDSAAEVAQAEEISLAFEQDSQKITPALLQYFYSIEDETKQRLFIRNFQAQVVTLCDKLFNPTGAWVNDIQEDDNHGIDTPRSVLRILEDLSAFIWSHFPACCDPNQKLPKKSQRTFFKEITEKLESLSLPESDPDHGLFEKVKASVQFKLHGNGPTLNYGMMAYLNEFVKGIGNVRSSNQEIMLLMFRKSA